MKLRLKDYLIEVYEADRIAIDEPRTYAWEITLPDTKNPHKIHYASQKDYDFTIHGIFEALQNALDAIQ